MVERTGAGQATALCTRGVAAAIRGVRPRRGIRRKPCDGWVTIGTDRRDCLTGKLLRQEEVEKVTGGENAWFLAKTSRTEESL